jgi:hypothetical protein
MPWKDHRKPVNWDDVIRAQKAAPPRIDFEEAMKGLPNFGPADDQTIPQRAPKPAGAFAEAGHDPMDMTDEERKDPEKLRLWIKRNFPNGLGGRS